MIPVFSSIVPGRVCPRCQGKLITDDGKDGTCLMCARSTDLDRPICAIYARVSTLDKGQDPENQVNALRDYAERRGWSLGAVYQEHESAWKAGHQAELARAIEDARRGRFQVLVVWSLDRISREGALAVLTLFKRLGDYKVRVVSLQEPWTEAPGELQEVLLALAGWVARMESQRRSERTKAGMARLAASGKRLGRPPGSMDKKKRTRRRALQSTAQKRTAPATYL